MRIRILMFLFLFVALDKSFSQSHQKKILFVCEHGSAKSIVAAAQFAKLAKQQGLDIQVVSRGINPDSTVSDAVNQHLTADGFNKHKDKPVKLSTADLKSADYVVLFNPLPDKFVEPSTTEKWNIPSFEAGYPIAKDSILTNIERIIQRIKTENKK